jgi:hypothetical protein
MRQRFCERVLCLPKKTDIAKHEATHRKWLNLEIRKRIAGCAIIEESEVPSLVVRRIKEKHGDYVLRFYLGGKVIYVASMSKDPYDNDKVKPFFVTCYKKEGAIGDYYLSELYTRADVIRKTL